MRFEPLDTFPFPTLRSLVRIAWWTILDKVWYSTRYKLERKGVYFCPVWCWPQTTFRFNSSLMWGASPYKEWAFGPVRYRRYQ